MNETDPGNEKRSFFALVAYGIHSRYQSRILRMLEEEFKTRSFLMYEYFQDKPVIRASKEPVSIFEPFIMRILSDSLFVPDLSNDRPSDWRDINHVPSTYENNIRFWGFKSVRGARVTDVHKYSFVAKDVLDAWQREERERTSEKGWSSYDPDSGLVTGSFEYDIEFLRKEYLQQIQEFDDISRLGLLKEYTTSVLPWLNCEHLGKLCLTTVSISSKKLFYGYILIFHPPIAGTNGLFGKLNGEGSRAVKELKAFIQRVYAPLLALFENYWEEKQLSQELDRNPKWENFVFDNPTLLDSTNTIERALAALWQARRSFYENHLPSGDVVERISESLLFSRYLITSEVMIESLEKLAVPRNKQAQSRVKDYLPCVLVIGGPGSGKDDIARMAHLFFPEYRFGPVYTINMASLKPNYLSVPLMAGFEAQITGKYEREGRDSAIGAEATIAGIFSKIWKEHKDKYPTESEMRKARSEGLMPVVILDELNSLDIDAQGSLLRILQNAELQPLGSTKSEKIDFLVVGVINEPEHTLTLEDPLRKLINDKEIFGGILGRTLYEYVRGLRRLRDDLYYRLVRDGKFVLQDLRQRREEIPILFAFFMKKEIDDTLGDSLPWDNLWFDFRAFERIMDKSIEWPGNFRELQSFAKRASSVVLQDEENRKEIGRICAGDADHFVHVSEDHIVKVIHEFFGIDF